MSLLRREQEAKLSLIESIAHSQQALARILDSVASVSAHSEVSARSLAENIRLLSRYQEEMSRMVTGIRLAQIQHGEPGEPWLKDPGYAIRMVRNIQEEC
ncbi:hypothetical protein B2I21_14100 [Chryseobacterium mucoviscidosis]|uniref:Aspartyl-phosphate phosphatase Spo0E family protein n=1 Tax=Paenibacillus vandeheii TaxID=3035917 RepID=A0ABT8JJB6_9BACL|nr:MULTISPECIES: hypothetical protein [Paenibacillus]MDN4604532.1 hypothetical protein [Paenibacillus vandeheii]MDN8592348.1 hypothetical protein [Paenibacillus sp. 11B]OPG97683.1 hypothetical protein B2I21_14100 [Chryseobacterium mucoviscidosis]